MLGSQPDGTAQNRRGEAQPCKPHPRRAEFLALPAFGLNVSRELRGRTLRIRLHGRTYLLSSWLPTFLWP
jgi:hypothetical protein